MKGIYISLTEGDVSAYRVTLDQDGKELQREKLPSAPTSPRILPAANPAGGAGGGRGAGRGASGGGRGGGRGRAGGTAPADIAFTPPSPSPRSVDWNSVETMIDENSVRAWVNDISEATIGRAEEENGRFGPIALFVGGTGEVRWKDIAYKDLAIRNAPAEQVSSRFRMQRLDEFYYAWSATAADFNHDGVLDLLAGPFLYFGPDFTKSREMVPGEFPSRRLFRNTNYDLGFAQPTGQPFVITAQFKVEQNSEVSNLCPAGEFRVSWHSRFRTTVTKHDCPETGFLPTASPMSASMSAGLNRSRAFVIVTPNDGTVNVLFDSKASTSASHPAQLLITLASIGPSGPTGANGATGSAVSTGPAGEPDHSNQVPSLLCAMIIGNTPQPHDSSKTRASAELLSPPPILLRV
jgi:hypothetical protein